MKEKEPIEIQALQELLKGSTLLKAGRSGKPHFRRFILADDLQSIKWESPQKSDASVKISEITDVLKGQNTKVFQQNPIPEHKELSFSILYSGRTLDVVCKDKKEFEMWMIGIETLRKQTLSSSQIEKLKQSMNQNSSDKLQVVFDSFSTKVVIREDASDVYTWGDGKWGKLGHGEDNDESIPRVLEALLGRNIVHIACGPKHMVAIAEQGEVYSWGDGKDGKLGNGKERNRYTPLAIAGLRGKYVTRVACGESHSAGISSSGDLYTWGRGDFGQLGYDEIKQLSPRLVDNSYWDGMRVIQVCCGKNSTIVLIEDGRIFSFGQGDNGQLGHGDKLNQKTPKNIEEFSSKSIRIQKITAGTEHAAALSDKGQLYVWGCNTRGQTGHGHGDENLEIITIPKVLSSLPQIVDVSCGGAHTLASTVAGALYAFGDGQHGQLGTGTTEKFVSSPKFIPIPENKKVLFVACGSNVSAIIVEGYTLLMCGEGKACGGDSSKNQLTFQPVEALMARSTRGVFCSIWDASSSSPSVISCAALVSHGWVPDHEALSCMACKKTFTQVRRRHHCRKCGGVFCGNCSSKKFPLLEAGFSEPVRVCDKCYTIVSTKN